MLTQANQPFQRGVNVLGYDPYWTDTSKRRFEWRHFAEIKKGGFDFVRVVLQAFKHMDAHNRLDPAWLAKLDDVVAEAQKAGLGVIIDEHDFNPCSEELIVCRTKLTAFWQQVAPRFANAPRSVASSSRSPLMTSTPWRASAAARSLSGLRVRPRTRNPLPCSACATAPP